MVVVIMRVLSVVVVMKNVLNNAICDEIGRNKVVFKMVIMMMVMMTIMKIVVIIYFSCSQCCLLNSPDFLTFRMIQFYQQGHFLSQMLSYMRAL